jgi:glycosyltransferase involved in cell wall biosynthesis
LHWSETLKSGVFHKVTAQIKAWQNLGLDVGLFILSRRDVRDAWVSVLGETVKHVVLYTPWDRVLAPSQLAYVIWQWKPDTIYTRYDLFYPPFAALFASKPTIVEINTDDQSEFELIGGRVRAYYNTLTRFFNLGVANGFVFVTHELAQRYDLDKPYAVIGNSIDLGQYAWLPPSEETTPQLVFMGTEHVTWHGVDKIQKLAEQFPSWHFHMIGLQAGGPSNMFWYGSLDRADYSKIMQKAHVAIGPLALHRKDMSEASPLKVREYLAHGLPVIIAYDETDFRDPVDFLLKLPNIENNIDTKKITKFVEAWRHKRVERACVQHLDTGVKEAKRVEFLRSFVKG